jgi:hypothetical protein
MNSSNLIAKSFKLVLRRLDKGPRPKSGKLRLNLHGSCFGGKIHWFRHRNSAKGELLIWRTKNIRTKIQSNSRIRFASNQDKLVPRKLDPGPLSKVDPQHWFPFHEANWTFKPTFSWAHVHSWAMMLAPFSYCTKIKWDIVWALQTTCSTPKQLLSSIKVWKSQKASKQSTKLPCHYSGAFLFVFL